MCLSTKCGAWHGSETSTTVERRDKVWVHCGMAGDVQQNQKVKANLLAIFGLSQ